MKGISLNGAKGLKIAELWKVPVSAAESLYPCDRPIIQDSVTDLKIGCVSLRKNSLQHLKRPFVEISSSLHVLERIACCVKYNEPVLLVGETGTGKTTIVQNLASRLGQKLTVFNLSQQSDVADLLGGFKPTDEGSFVTALRKCEWILLDEVNLAPPETLQRIVGVLEGERVVLCLANFRIFAYMNPATDVGKRDLAFSLRSRFTEYFVDAANQKPQYSLRSLYRALEYTRKAERKFGCQKALYDGFSMFFVSLLDGSSAEIIRQKILALLLGGHMPRFELFSSYLDSVKSYGYSGDYVQTKTVQEHLGNLARAVLMRYPVLLQGPTSRSYVTDAGGKLVFNEGVLVKAVRNGYWIVLDELNLV
ncbi:hypothetical protein Fmac_016097 [Flemingia macrophylla]|uniref:AAA+ ATPase domain-containing protein n=1 Tax=Flemingia macrophylla TaxID=520843 RepID=A0ABD1MGF4_9FABA